MLAICRYWNFQAASACSSREAFCNQPAVSAAEQLARNRLVLASLPNGQRDARTEGRMYGLPARTATSTRRFQFSLVQFASSQLASARFSSFRFVTFRFVSSLSLSPVASRYWHHGPPARRSVPADILPVILVGAVVVVVNFSMCRLGISELAQCKPTPRHRGKIYGTTGPFPCPLLPLHYHANMHYRSSLANNCIAYFWAERVKH